MVLIKNSQKALKINTHYIQDITEALLAYLGLSKKDLSILFVDNKKITRMNHKYFQKNKPTNVISFSYTNGLPCEVIGDIVISLEKTKEEAESLEVSVSERVLALIIHGLLHILGFDHEKGKKERRKMHYREKKLFNFVVSHTLYSKITL